MLLIGIGIWWKLVGKGRLTTSHIRASNTGERESRLLHVVTHANSRTITLVNAIDKEVSESGMSASKLSSSSCEDNNLDV